MIEATGPQAPDDPAEPIELLVVSDYISPWCYVGHVRVEKLRREYPVEVTWIPFELHPGLPPEGAPREALFGPEPPDKAYRDHLKQTAAEAGIVIRRTDVIANSLKAFEAVEFARDADAHDCFGEALFRAYFSEKRNIGLVDVLVELAAECGLDAAALREALADGRHETRVHEASNWAKSAGVTGTPTFIFGGKYAVVGAQPYEVLERVMARLGVPKRETNPEPPPLD